MVTMVRSTVGGGWEPGPATMVWLTPEAALLGVLKYEKLPAIFPHRLMEADSNITHKTIMQSKLDFQPLELIQDNKINSVK